eukprot:6208516-Pleurochrysis_carterae.AAC.1
MTKTALHAGAVTETFREIRQSSGRRDYLLQSGSLKEWCCKMLQYTWLVTPRDAAAPSMRKFSGSAWTPPKGPIMNAKCILSFKNPLRNSRALDIY